MTKDGRKDPRELAQGGTLCISECSCLASELRLLEAVYSNYIHQFVGDVIVSELQKPKDLCFNL